MRPVRVLFLTQWFEPEDIAKGLKFALGLTSRGFDVEVATGFPNYPSGKLAAGYRLRPYQRDVMQGVQIHRLWLYPSHDRSSIGRAMNYLSFFVTALVFCLLHARRFDVLYVYHPPITVGLAAALSGLVTRRPFLLDVQDLWPDSVAASRMGGTTMLSKVLDPLCRFVYRRARLVTGQSEGMTERLIERGVARENASTSFNWADEEAARPGGGYDVSSLGFDGRFNFVFGGNLGTVQGLETLVDAAQRAAREAPEIQLTLIGNGVERERLATRIEQLGATNVKLRPAAPRSQIGDVFAAADVLVFHLVDDPLFQITIPSKTQFYMAMGKPIIAAVRGEAARIVVRAGAGIAVEPQDVQAMTTAMVALARTPRDRLAAMGAKARAAYDDCFSFDAGLRATAVLLRGIVADRGALGSVT